MPRTSLSNAQIRSEVHVYNSAGRGSTNTAVWRFSQIAKNVGTAVTYQSSATLGDSFTINEDGLYFMRFSVDFGSADNFGISKNSAALSTNITTQAAGVLVVWAQSQGVNAPGHCSDAIYLQAGDVIRPHVNPATSPGGNGGTASFRITKINT